MTLSELDTPRLSCGRTACRASHDWVGGRCPGNATTPTVIDVATLADEVRDQLRAARLATVDQLRDRARAEVGNPGSAHRRSALGQAANDLDREARRA